MLGSDCYSWRSDTYIIDSVSALRRTPCYPQIRSIACHDGGRSEHHGDSRLRVPILSQRRRLGPSSTRFMFRSFGEHTEWQITGQTVATADVSTADRRVLLLCPRPRGPYH